MEIYIIRHGETQWNKLGKIQGQVDIPLNEYGKSLADETSKAFRDIGFTVCFSSPLGRAYETATRVLAGKKIPIIKDSRLQEMGFGLREGAPFYAGDEISEGMKQFHENPDLYQPLEGGETFQDLYERLGEFFEELIHSEKYQDDTVLISSHGCAISAILNYVKGNSIHDFWKEGLLRNCGVVKMHIVNQEPIIDFIDRIYYKE